MPAKNKPFAVKLGQRIPVPGKKGVQGVVNTPRFNDAAKPRAVNEQQFYLTWVKEDGSGADGWFTAAEIEAAFSAAGAEIVANLKSFVAIARQA